jgi:hypothetical protein
LIALHFFGDFVLIIGGCTWYLLQIFRRDLPDVGTEFAGVIHQSSSIGSTALDPRTLARGHKKVIGFAFHP